MPPFKVGRPVHRVTKTYRILEKEPVTAGTFALVERTRKCQGIVQGVAYGIVGSRVPLEAAPCVLDRLPAADQSGRLGLKLTHREAWFADLKKARRILARVVLRGVIPKPK